eukprot:PhF_6_TR7822/c0_g1_i1/m.11269
MTVTIGIVLVVSFLITLTQTIEVSTLVGSQNCSSRWFRSSPRSLVVSPNDTMYVIDSTCVYAFSTSGSIFSVLAGSPTISGDVDGTFADARFGSLSALAYDRRNDRIFIMDSGNAKVRVMYLQEGVVRTLKDKAGEVVVLLPSLYDTVLMDVSLDGTLYLIGNLSAANKNSSLSTMVSFPQQFLQPPSSIRIHRNSTVMYYSSGKRIYSYSLFKTVGEKEENQQRVVAEASVVIQDFVVDSAETIFAVSGSCVLYSQENQLFAVTGNCAGTAEMGYSDTAPYTFSNITSIAIGYNSSKDIYVANNCSVRNVSDWGAIVDVKPLAVCNFTFSPDPWLLESIDYIVGSPVVQWNVSLNCPPSTAVPFDFPAALTIINPSGVATSQRPVVISSWGIVKVSSTRDGGRQLFVFDVNDTKVAIPPPLYITIRKKIATNQVVGKAIQLNRNSGVHVIFDIGRQLTGDEVFSLKCVSTGNAFDMSPSNRLEWNSTTSAKLSVTLLPIPGMLALTSLTCQPEAIGLGLQGHFISPDALQVQSSINGLVVKMTPDQPWFLSGQTVTVQLTPYFTMKDATTITFQPPQLFTSRGGVILPNSVTFDSLLADPIDVVIVLPNVSVPMCFDIPYASGSVFTRAIPFRVCVEGIRNVSCSSVSVYPSIPQRTQCCLVSSLMIPNTTVSVGFSTLTSPPPNVTFSPSTLNYEYNATSCQTIEIVVSNPTSFRFTQFATISQNVTFTPFTFALYNQSNLLLTNLPSFVFEGNDMTASFALSSAIGDVIAIDAFPSLSSPLIQMIPDVVRWNTLVQTRARVTFRVVEGAYRTLPRTNPIIPITLRLLNSTSSLSKFAKTLYTFNIRISPKGNVTVMPATLRMFSDERKLFCFNVSLSAPPVYGTVLRTNLTLNDTNNITWYTGPESNITTATVQRGFRSDRWASHSLCVNQTGNESRVVSVEISLTGNATQQYYPPLPSLRILIDTPKTVTCVIPPQKLVVNVSFIIVCTITPTLPRGDFPPSIVELPLVPNVTWNVTRLMYEGNTNNNSADGTNISVSAISRVAQNVTGADFKLVQNVRYASQMQFLIEPKCNVRIDSMFPDVYVGETLTINVTLSCPPYTWVELGIHKNVSQYLLVSSSSENSNPNPVWMWTNVNGSEPVAINVTGVQPSSGIAPPLFTLTGTSSYEYEMNTSWGIPILAKNDVNLTNSTSTVLAIYGAQDVVIMYNISRAEWGSGLLGLTVPPIENVTVTIDGDSGALQFGVTSETNASVLVQPILTGTNTRMYNPLPPFTLIIDTQKTLSFDVVTKVRLHVKDPFTLKACLSSLPRRDAGNITVSMSLPGCVLMSPSGGDTNLTFSGESTDTCQFAIVMCDIAGTTTLRVEESPWLKLSTTYVFDILPKCDLYASLAGLSVLSSNSSFSRAVMIPNWVVTMLFSMSCLPSLSLNITFDTWNDTIATSPQITTILDNATSSKFEIKLTALRPIDRVLSIIPVLTGESSGEYTFRSKINISIFNFSDPALNTSQVLLSYNTADTTAYVSLFSKFPDVLNAQFTSISLSKPPTTAISILPDNSRWEPLRRVNPFNFTIRMNSDVNTTFNISVRLDGLGASQYTGNRMNVTGNNNTNTTTTISSSFLQLPVIVDAAKSITCHVYNDTYPLLVGIPVNVSCCVDPGRPRKEFGVLRATLRHLNRIVSPPYEWSADLPLCMTNIISFPRDGQATLVLNDPLRKFIHSDTISTVILVKKCVVTTTLPSGTRLLELAVGEFVTMNFSVSCDVVYPTALVFGSPAALGTECWEWETPGAVNITGWKANTVRSMKLYPVCEMSTSAVLSWNVTLTNNTQFDVKWSTLSESISSRITLDPPSVQQPQLTPLVLAERQETWFRVTIENLPPLPWQRKPMNLVVAISPSNRSVVQVVPSTLTWYPTGTSNFNTQTVLIRALNDGDTSINFQVLQGSKGYTTPSSFTVSVKDVKVMTIVTSAPKSPIVLQGKSTINITVITSSPPSATLTVTLVATCCITIYPSTFLLTPTNDKFENISVVGLYSFPQAILSLPSTVVLSAVVSGDGAKEYATVDPMAIVIDRELNAECNWNYPKLSALKSQTKYSAQCCISPSLPRSEAGDSMLNFTANKKTFRFVPEVLTWNAKSNNTLCQQVSVTPIRYSNTTLSSNTSTAILVDSTRIQNVKMFALSAWFLLRTGTATTTKQRLPLTKSVSVSPSLHVLIRFTVTPSSVIDGNYLCDSILDRPRIVITIEGDAWEIKLQNEAKQYLLQSLPAAVRSKSEGHVSPTLRELTIIIGSDDNTRFKQSIFIALSSMAFARFTMGGQEPRRSNELNITFTRTTTASVLQSMAVQGVTWAVSAISLANPSGIASQQTLATLSFAPCMRSTYHSLNSKASITTAPLSPFFGDDVIPYTTRATGAVLSNIVLALAGVLIHAIVFNVIKRRNDVTWIEAFTIARFPLYSVYIFIVFLQPTLAASLYSLAVESFMFIAIGAVGILLFPGVVVWATVWVLRNVTSSVTWEEWEYDQSTLGLPRTHWRHTLLWLKGRYTPRLVLQPFSWVFSNLLPGYQSLYLLDWVYMIFVGSIAAWSELYPIACVGLIATCGSVMILYGLFFWRFLPHRTSVLSYLKGAVLVVQGIMVLLGVGAPSDQPWLIGMLIFFTIVYNGCLCAEVVVNYYISKWEDDEVARREFVVQQEILEKGMLEQELLEQHKLVVGIEDVFGLYADPEKMIVLECKTQIPLPTEPQPAFKRLKFLEKVFEL